MGISQTSVGQWASPGNSIDTYWSYGSVNTLWTTTGNNNAWGTANRIVYIPVRVKQRVVAVKLWCGGGTTGAGNIQIGIYDRLGARQIATATTAKGTAADEQVIDITDTTIGPGLYYLALQDSTTTDTFFGAIPTAPLAAAGGVRIQDTTFGLPSTATWTINQTHTLVPVIGMLLETTVA